MNVCKQIPEESKQKPPNLFEESQNLPNSGEEPKLIKYLKTFNENKKLEIFQSQVFECNVCFCEKLGKDCLEFPECRHVFCKDCMKAYFEVKINEGEMSNLTCPQDKCLSQALPTQVQALVSDKKFELYENVLLSTTLESMADIGECL